MDRTIIDNILTFWFSGTNKEKINRWFSKNPQIDEFITTNYGSITYKMLRAGFEFEKLLDTPKNGLVILIILDQFSRHIYRTHSRKEDIIDTALSKADRYANLCLEKGYDKLLNAEERISKITMQS